MRILRFMLLIMFVAGLLAAALPMAIAQQRNGIDLSGSLERLQNNPRYQGRIIGTQIRSTARGALYEVQILRRDDRVIIVYIDPETGGVVGDSQRQDRQYRGQGDRGDERPEDRGRGNERWKDRDRGNDRWDERGRGRN